MNIHYYQIIYKNVVTSIFYFKISASSTFLYSCTNNFYRYTFKAPKNIYSKSMILFEDCYMIFNTSKVLGFSTVWNISFMVRISPPLQPSLKIRTLWHMSRCLQKAHTLQKSSHLRTLRSFDWFAVVIIHRRAPVLPVKKDFRHSRCRKIWTSTLLKPVSRFCPWDLMRTIVKVNLTMRRRTQLSFETTRHLLQPKKRRIKLMLRSRLIPVW